MSTILVVDDIKGVREQYAYDINRKTDHEVVTASNGQEALDLLTKEAIDLVVLDLEMPVVDGLEMLEQMDTKLLDDISVIVYTAQGNFQKCVRAIKLGAYNFFDKNEVNLDQLIRIIENALEQRRLMQENRQLRHLSGRDSSLIGESQQTKALRKQILKVAAVPSNVVILGESGTGKEVVAREIHRFSDRSEKPFIAVNCAALPEHLVESELFGFEKGAFSGAIRTTKGKFEAANGGILLLDEISEMPLSVQAKLLRVLQENEINRLGSGGRTIPLDVRVLAASNRPLEQEMEEGKFREDLYYRICTHVVRIPPLRERPDDVGPLTIHFIERTCEKFGFPTKTLHPEALSILQSYTWEKNNVRELENIVERMIIQADGETILPEHVPADIRSPRTRVTSATNKSYQDLKYEAERHILLQALEENDWHITNTARALDISNHSNLLKMMRRLEIERPENQ